MAQLPITLKPFPVPTEVILDMPAGARDVGMVALPKLPLTQVPRETLETMIEEFAEAVLQAAGYTD